MGTAQRKQRNGRLKDQFHSLETALQRKDDRTVIVPAPRLCEGIGIGTVNSKFVSSTVTRDTHLVQVSQIKRFTEVNGEGILFKPVRYRSPDIERTAHAPPHAR